MKFPVVRPAGLWIPEVDALVLRQILRTLRSAAAFEILRRSNRQHPNVREFARHQGRTERLAESDSDVDTISHQVSNVFAGNRLDREFGVLIEETAEMSRQHEARKQGVDVDAQSAANL